MTLPYHIAECLRDLYDDLSTSIITLLLFTPEIKGYQSGIRPVLRRQLADLSRPPCFDIFTKYIFLEFNATFLTHRVFQCILSILCDFDYDFT
jgi:hypothetical protein